MKKLFLFLIISILIYGCSSISFRDSISDQEKYFNYSEKTEKTKVDAFRLVEEWLAVNAKDANQMIQLKNEETGTIVFKASCNITTGIGIATWALPYTTTIKLKDNSISYIFEVGQIQYSKDFWSGAAKYGYPAKDDMKEIEDTFVTIKNNITTYVNNH